MADTPYSADNHFLETYTPVYRDGFLTLFSRCFEDDPETIMESICRAVLKLAVRDGGVVGFVLYEPYDDIRSVVVEYVGVSPDYRRQGIAREMFRYLYDRFPGWKFFGECRWNTPITVLLERQGWSAAPVRWLCPAWGNIPEDRTRCLMCLNAKPEDIPAVAKAFYDYGYGVSRDDLVEGYKKELGLC